MRKRILATLAALALSVTAAADVEVGLRSCAALKSAETRLACYDSLAENIGIKPAPPAEAGESFGKEHYRSERAADSITVRASTVVRDVYGKTVVELSNGQFWRQVGNERIDIEPGESIVIERGALNSFFFVLGESERKVKFTRVD